MCALETGTTVAEEFIKKRIIDKSVDFYDSLSKNNLNTFKSMAAVTKVKVNGQLEILKDDRNLFARLAVIGQTRSMDIREVFSHSMGPVPWSLATTDGDLAKTQKPKLAEALEMEVPPLDKDSESVVWDFDAMAVVQALVQIPDTFGELAEHLFSTIKWQAKDALRIDIVFDTYPEISIKNAKHFKRAQKGKLKTNISNANQKCPRQWKKLLSSGGNKDSFSHFVVREWSSAKYCTKLHGFTLFVPHGHECHRISTAND